MGDPRHSQDAHGAIRAAALDELSASTPSAVAARIVVPPPPGLNWLVECLGADATLTLIETAAGMSIYVPPIVGASNKCSSVAVLEVFYKKFGYGLGKQLIRYFGGSEIRVPTAQKWRTILYAKQGMSPNDIAYRLGCSFQTVQRRLSAHHKSAKRQAGSTVRRRRVAFFIDDSRTTAE